MNDQIYFPERIHPVGITVYTRIDHLKRMLDSLRHCPEIKFLPIYFFSDGPKEGDEHAVFQMRQFIKNIMWHKNVTVVERDSNNRIYNNSQAQKFLLERYGSFIWLTEDLVLSNSFLSYMLYSLDKYRRDVSVFSINAYLPASFHNNSAFKSIDFNAWGFGTWSDRNWLSARIYSKDDVELSSNNKSVELISRYHPYFNLMMKVIRKRGDGPADYLLSSYTARNYLYNIKPGKPLVHNTGFDGSGVGKKRTTAHDTVVAERVEFELPDNIQYDHALDKKYFSALFSLPPFLLLCEKCKLVAHLYLPSFIIKSLKKLYFK